MHEVVFLAFQKAQKRETKAVLNKLVTVEYVQRFTQILWWLILLQKKKARLISKTLNGPSLSANILEALFSLGSCLSLGVAGDPWSLATFATKKSSTAGANGQKEDAASSPFFLSVHFQVWSSCHGVAQWCNLQIQARETEIWILPGQKVMVMWLAYQCRTPTLPNANLRVEPCLQVGQFGSSPSHVTKPMDVPATPTTGYAPRC